MTAEPAAAALQSSSRHPPAPVPWATASSSASGQARRRRRPSRALPRPWPGPVMTAGRGRGRLPLQRRRRLWQWRPFQQACIAGGVREQAGRASVNWQENCATLNCGTAAAIATHPPAGACLPRLPGLDHVHHVVILQACSMQTCGWSRGTTVRPPHRPARPPPPPPATVDRSGHSPYDPTVLPSFRICPL